MNNKVVVSAPAKINLCLNITGTDSRGYHSLETVMQSVALSDTLVIQKCSDIRSVNITCNNPGVPTGAHNIIHKAAELFFKETGITPTGLLVGLDKVIPMQAGLAGGSTNAAAMLVGLNFLFQTSLNTKKLCEIGVKCGADVPFCIVGGCQFASGIGEILTPIDDFPQCSIVIAKPPIGMSTEAAFKIYDSQGRDFKQADIKVMWSAIRATNLVKIGENMINVFEQVIHMPEVVRLKEVLINGGAVGAAMSGSGTAVFGIFDNRTEAEASIKHLSNYSCEVFLTVPVTYGSKILNIE